MAYNQLDLQNWSATAIRTLIVRKIVSIVPDGTLTPMKMASNLMAAYPAP